MAIFRRVGCFTFIFLKESATTRKGKQANTHTRIRKLTKNTTKKNKNK
jgi:hypothetical protein